jgi:acyl-CoA hydrolase
MSINERAKALISISHPEDRETLDRQWFEIKQKHTRAFLFPLNLVEFIADRSE